MNHETPQRVPEKDLLDGAFDQGRQKLSAVRGEIGLPPNFGYAGPGTLPEEAVAEPSESISSGPDGSGWTTTEPRSHQGNTTDLPATVALPSAAAHEGNQQQSGDSTESSDGEKLPPPKFEINEDAYWQPGDGAPTKSQLATLKNAVRDAGRGFGGKVRQIATNDRFNPESPNNRAPIHKDGDHFARLALEYKNADKARREKILDEQLAPTGLEGKNYEAAYKEARRRLKKDLQAAAELEPQEISELGQAINDYRFLKKDLEHAGLAYKKGNVIRRGASKTYDILASPGTAAAAALIRLRTRKSTADPEKTDKLRRGLKVGAVAVVGVFFAYRGAAGVAELAQTGSGMDFVEGATDLTYWPPITESDSGKGGKALSLDLGGDSGGGTPEQGPDNGQMPGNEPPGHTPDGQPDGGSEHEQPPATEQPVTDEQRKIDRGMASMDKFEQLGVDRKDYYNFLDEKITVNGEKLTIGEQLQKDGVLYWEPDARNGQGEWRLNYSGGELADDKIQWIREKAEAKGYLDGAESAAEAPEPETPQDNDRYTETDEIGKFNDKLDQKTGYLNGTGMKATALELNDLAQDLGYNELDFKKLQQTPGFNEAYYRFMDEHVLPFNGLSWHDAEHLPPDYKFKIPTDPAKDFLEGIAGQEDAASRSGGNEQPAEAPAGPPLPEASGETVTVSSESGPLPDNYEIRTNDDYRSVFGRIAENDPRTPDQLKNETAQSQFLQDLLADRDKIARLYKGVEGDTMSASWNSYLAESIFVPQVERGGRWYIDPVFIANAIALMRQYANLGEGAAGEYELAA